MMTLDGQAGLLGITLNAPGLTATLPQLKMLSPAFAHHIMSADDEQRRTARASRRLYTSVVPECPA
jgi:hypothetical protein